MSVRQEVIVRDVATLGGAPVFAGTRVPVQTMLDYLAAGQPLDGFLDDFPTVKKAIAIAALEELKQALLGKWQ